MWITYKFYHHKWWTAEATNTTVNNCTDKQLEEFMIMGRLLALSPYALRNSDRDKDTDQGIVSSDLHVYKYIL